MPGKVGSMDEIAPGAEDVPRLREFPKDRPLSDAERAEWMASWLLAKAVGWEAYALAQAVAAARDEPSSMRGTLFLEAALIHQRCLIEFLVGRVNRKGARSWKERSDVTPAALCDGWEPEAALGAALGDLTVALADIDSLLAHVSRRRAELVRRTWNLGSWTLAVFTALDVFVSWLRTVEPFRATAAGLDGHSPRAPGRRRGRPVRAAGRDAIVERDVHRARRRVSGPCGSAYPTTRWTWVRCVSSSGRRSGCRSGRS